MRTALTRGGGNSLYGTDEDAQLVVPLSSGNSVSISLFISNLPHVMVPLAYLLRFFFKLAANEQELVFKKLIKKICLVTIRNKNEPVSSNASQMDSGIVDFREVFFQNFRRASRSLV